MTTPPITTPPITTPPVTPTVTVSDAFVAYPSPAGTKMALRGLDLTVQAGERLLIQGPNGSGKSTLLRVLTGEQAAIAGSVMVDGTDLTKLSSTARRRWRRAGVGMVDQHARRALLPEWRVLENVALQLRLAGVAGREANDRAAATLDRLGLGSLARRSISTLSGGEAQRVAICAALAHDPALILADEPTGELDEAAARQVYALLAQAGRPHGAALILISHDRRAADTVDRVVRMQDGRVAEQWRPGDAAGANRVADEHRWPGPPAVLPPAPSSPRDHGSVPVLRFERVGVSFDTRTLFSAVDLVLRPGDHVVLRGPSGSGKSTILGLAAGLSDPSYGTVTVAGTSWGPLDRAARAALRGRHVAVSLQSTILAEALTVHENLGFSARLRHGEGNRTQTGQSAHIASTASDLGLTALLEQPVRLLSGGERQRVAVARCLVSGAALILLDEPTSQQDEASATAVARAVRAATQAGRAVLASSHDPVFLQSAGTVLDMGVLGRAGGSDQPPR